MREAGSVINWTTLLPPLTKTTFPTSALFDTTMSFGFTPCLEPALTVMLFLKVNESYPMMSAGIGFVLFLFSAGNSERVCSLLCSLYIVSCCSIILFLNWETCSSSCFFTCALRQPENTLSKKLLAELLQKQVAHCNGLTGVTQVILIRLESLGGKNKKLRDIAKRMIIAAMGFFMRSLKLGVDVLIL